MGPQEGLREEQRTGAPPLQGLAERVGTFWPWQEKALGGTYRGIPVPGGSLKESWGGTLCKGM